MAPRVNEVQERRGTSAEPAVRRDELLARHGVRIPTRRDAAPFRTAGRRRPRWLAFVLRLFA